MDPFLQDAPQAANRFRADPTLRHTLERILPPDAFAEASPLFDEMGERSLTDLKALSLHAEAHTPVHLPFDAWASGQWMTEKEGGSDVGRTGTIAREAGDGWWTLHGTKWFTSATTADIA